jgi:hypothetical protein
LTKCLNNLNALCAIHIVRQKKKETKRGKKKKKKRGKWVGGGGGGEGNERKNKEKVIKLHTEHSALSYFIPFLITLSCILTSLCTFMREV